MPRIVIVGGGIAGISCAQFFARYLKSSDHTQVVVLEKSKYYYHVIGAPRAYVDEDYATKMFIPYDNAIPKHAAGFVQIIRAVATKLFPNKLTYQEIGDDDRKSDVVQTMEFNYLVLATGSTYVVPIQQDPNIPSRNHTEAKLKEVREHISKAKRILIVGGGAVGCEVAADIKVKYPETEVTIVNAHDKLLAGNKLVDKFYTYLNPSMEKLGINVILGERLEERLTTNCFEKRTLKTDKGRVIESDIQLLCAGFRGAGDLAEKISPSLVTAHGTIKVNDRLQLDDERFQNVFVVGDAGDSPAPKLAHWAYDQSRFVANEILAVIRKKQTGFKKAFPDTGVEGMTLTLGPDGGVMQIPLFGGLVVGDFLTRWAKSRDYAAGRVWNLFGASLSN